MKLKLFPFLFIASILFCSCEKDNDSPETTPSLDGNWLIYNSAHEFTPNTSFSVVDLFGLPWQGSIVIDKDGNSETVHEFTYMKDNVFGDYHWSNDTLSASMIGSELTLSYNSETYSKTVNSGLQLGIILLSGDYTSESNSTLSLNGLLEAQEIQCESGKEYSLKDGLAHERQNIFSMQFLDGGSFTGYVLDLDVLFPIEGTWSQDKDMLTIVYKLTHQDNSFTKSYKAVRDGSTLNLYELLEINSANCTNLGISPSSIDELKYHLTYKLASY